MIPRRCLQNSGNYWEWNLSIDTGLEFSAVRASDQFLWILEVLWNSCLNAVWKYSAALYFPVSIQTPRRILGTMMHLQTSRTNKSQCQHSTVKWLACLVIRWCPLIDWYPMLSRGPVNRFLKNIPVKVCRCSLFIERHPYTWNHVFFFFFFHFFLHRFSMSFSSHDLESKQACALVKLQFMSSSSHSPSAIQLLLCIFGSERLDTRRPCWICLWNNAFVRSATWPWSLWWATWFLMCPVTATMGTRPAWQMVTMDMHSAQWHPASRPSFLMQWLHITLTTSCHPSPVRRCTKVTQLTWTNSTSHCWRHGAQRTMWAFTRRRRRRRRASEWQKSFPICVVWLKHR